MARPPRYGYESRPGEKKVLITRGCRLVASVHGADRVHTLLAELRADDPQRVLARWAETGHGAGAAASGHPTAA
ncbi:hypothetical protein ACWEN3_41295 [Streptomyces sp. NPDC004561]